MKDKQGRTPLFNVMNPRLVQAMLDEGANGSVVDEKGISILEHYLMCKPANAKPLLDNGVSTNNKDLANPELLITYDLSILKEEVIL